MIEVAFNSLGAPRGQRLCLIHPVAQVSSITSMTPVSLSKGGATSLASYEKLLREWASLGQLARQEPLQPNGPPCRLSVLEANPSYGQ